MHPLKHPRNALVVGLVFVLIAFVYWAIPYFFNFQLDYAGTTMLAVLGIAMALMAYVLIAGSPNE
jgi:ammonia channel protein AmtB